MSGIQNGMLSMNTEFLVKSKKQAHFNSLIFSDWDKKQVSSMF